VSVPLLLVLDGNNLLHRAYHAAPIGRILDGAGRPVWALQGLVGYIARAAAQLRPDAVIVGFDCPERSARMAAWPGYKAQRGEKPGELAVQLASAPGLLRAAGLSVVVATAYEADDVLASAAAHARRSGWRSVLVTSDRDAFALLDPSTSILGLRNGGFGESVLVTAASLPAICGVEPWQYRDYAALCGDPSDNLDGVPGFGSVTAAALLAAFGSVDAAWAALDDGQGAAVRALLGDAACERLGSPESRRTVDRNRGLMRMRDDVPMPDLDAVRLPIDVVSMRRALRGRGINLGPSLWALTGGSPPPTDDDVAPAPVWTRSLRARRDPTPGQLVLF
jgi:5'-3' exonuclease